MASSNSIISSAISPFSIFAWNVDRYNRPKHDFLLKYVQKHEPTIIFLGETKQSVPFLNVFFPDFVDYVAIINSHNPPRYHGVAMLIRKGFDFEELKVSFDIPTRKDTMGGDATVGRIIAIKIDGKIVVGVYSPNSGMKWKNLPYRVDLWDKKLYGLLDEYRKNGNGVILIGDINVAPERIDISSYSMTKWAGFSKEERENFKTFLSDSWSDVWRDKNPEVRKYTWVGYKGYNDYGMRLDNIVVSKNIAHEVKDASILSNVSLSDHVPITMSF